MPNYEMYILCETFKLLSQTNIFMCDSSNKGMSERMNTDWCSKRIKGLIKDE